MFCDIALIITTKGPAISTHPNVQAQLQQFKSDLRF
jgi:hypothetical protein